MDLQTEIEKLKIKVKRRKPKGKYYKSKLDKWKFQILALHAKGATLLMLQIWLKEKNISVEKSTISRWLKKNGDQNG